MDIKTTDLSLTAYLLAHKLTPKTIIAEGGKRKKIVFVFSASQRTSQLLDEFRSGNATANIILFRSKLEYARDVMFSKLRGLTDAER